MLGQHPPLLLLLLVATLWSILCNAAPTGILYVYRGDSRSPDQIKAAGGFLPKGVKGWGPSGYIKGGAGTSAGPANPDISLFNHVAGVNGQSRDNDGYVSTSTAMAVAKRFLDGMGGGYLYKIRVAENMIDCAGTLGRYYNYGPEFEYAALGGVKYQQIVSWKKYKVGQNLDLIKEVPNSKFDRKKYDKKDVVAGGIQYQLAGFPANHPAWKQAPWKNHKPCNLKRALGAKKPATVGTSPAKTTPAKQPPVKQPTVPAVPKGQPPVKQPPVNQPPVKQPTVPAVPKGQPPVKQPPVKQPPVKQPPVKQPPVEKPPVEQPPVEKPPVEQPPVEQPPVEQPPVEQPPVEQPPVEQPPVEQPPVEQPPTVPSAPQSCSAGSSTNFDLAMAYMKRVETLVW